MGPLQVGTLNAQVIELTGLLRTGPGGDQLTGWSTDMRIFARRTPRAPGEQAQLGQDPSWRYGAFATNTPTGQVQYLDVRHRTQAHVWGYLPLAGADRIKELKACGATLLPSTSYARNSAWLHLAAHAVTVLAWLRLLALDGDLAVAEPKTLRFRLFSAPARFVRHARSRVLKIPTGWAWASPSPTPSPASARCTPPEQRAPLSTHHPEQHPTRGNRRPPERIGHPATPTVPATTSTRPPRSRHAHTPSP